MDRDCLASVLDGHRLPNGLVWTMPIVLPVAREAAACLGRGDRVVLARQDGSPHSVLDVSEIFQFDPDVLAREWFGTDSQAHPGVARIRARGDHFLAGEVALIQPLPLPYRRYDLTPAQLRAVFAHKGWNRVVGFHSRNLVHRGHEALQLAALERTHADGLLIIGARKQRAWSFPHLISTATRPCWLQALSVRQVVLASFITYRLRGARCLPLPENVECNHFIVERNHAGGWASTANDSRVRSTIADIGIEPVLFNASDRPSRSATSG
jgi:ATP sulfurylase